MGSIQSFTGLRAWQESHLLVLKIYDITQKFPKQEIFGLTDQIRRAAISISSNVAEGFSRFSQKEKRQFYRMALASLREVQNQLLIARDVHYIDKLEFDALAQQTVVVSKLINGVIKSAVSYNTKA
jgi:four helix bundle protein